MSVSLHTTTCVMDCPDGCGLEIRTEDGKVRSIGPDRNSGTDFICSKVARFDRRLYAPERLTKPLRRVGAKGGGEFEEISWDEALDEIAVRFRDIRRQWGGEAILPYHYGGSNGLLTDGLIDHLFFARLGASRLDKTICAVPATEVAVGMYGKMPGVPFSDYPLARCIVVWGANPKSSNIHLVPQLKEARRRGAFVAAVDPKQTLSDREVDLHLPVFPGQDLPVALALIDQWRRAGQLDHGFLAEHADGLDILLDKAAEWSLDRAAEVSGVPAADIALLAERLADSSPAVIRCGWGLERNRNGAQAIAAVLAIPSLLGKFGVRGGGYTLSNNGGVRFDRDAVLGPIHHTTRSLNMTQLGRLIDPQSDENPSPPIQGLFVYNANPVASTPHQRAIERGLAREDLFTVVHEQVMTDTAVWADIVLPAVTFLEGTDLRVSYGEYVAGGVRPVIAPAGEARSNMQVFSALARRLGFEDEAFTWDDQEILRRCGESLVLAGEPGSTSLAAGDRQPYQFEGGSVVQFGSVRPGTADGRVDLAPSRLGQDPYGWQPLDSDYPLAMISAASSQLTNSTFGEFNLDTLRIEIHPNDAAGRGVATGDAVKVFNWLGEVHCHARINPKIRPGVIAMPKGAWKRSSLNGYTSVALCPDDGQVVGEAACFNDARVEVTKLSSPIESVVTS
ncbi:MAG: molybdopterin-dependent oxidoreductase [Thermoanaerobaculia bacterium]|nr:molybdopterin-dependent oxidoreductase [Thermoanaerobaculia bacterium]